MFRFKDLPPVKPVNLDIDNNIYTNSINHINNNNNNSFNGNKASKFSAILKKLDYDENLTDEDYSQRKTETDRAYHNNVKNSNNNNNHHVNNYTNNHLAQQDEDDEGEDADYKKTK